MAISSFPFYSTSYGSTFGYNEQNGSDCAHLQKRYSHHTYRGTPGIASTHAYIPSYTIQARELERQNKINEGNKIEKVQTSSRQTRTTNTDTRPHLSTSITNNTNISSTISSSSSSPSSFSSHSHLNSSIAPPLHSHLKNSTIEDDNNHSFHPPSHSSISTSSSSFSPSATAPLSSFSAFSSTLPPPSTSSPSSSAFYRVSNNGFNPANRNLLEQTIQQHRLTPLASSQSTSALSSTSHMNTNINGKVPVLNKYGSYTYQHPPRPSSHSSASSSSSYRCKESISRRISDPSTLVSHLPKYTGFIPTEQFRHGQSYYKISKDCLNKREIQL